ncbi:MAG: hypothetical protein R3362_10885, partial [Rhodothermales bacterium]|nr:hypothetical protein [Rhodothermales bacterium]
ADVGRALEAERVLAGEVARFGRTVEEQERETRATQTRSGERALYDRVEEDVTLTGVVAFEVVDPRAREAACEGEVERTARGRIVRGEYEGRVRTLDLDRRERRLFDPERLAEQERAVEEALLDELAEAVAVAAFDCALEAVR